MLFLRLGHANSSLAILCLGSTSKIIPALPASDGSASWNIPTLPASDWSVVRTFPRFPHLIGPWRDPFQMDLDSLFFVDNVASRSGGAIRILDTTLAACLYHSCFFEGNHASEGGGAILQENALLDCTPALSGNSAVYGADLATPPAKVHLAVSSRFRCAQSVLNDDFVRSCKR
eukprot:538882-Pyramimonas_sp.AAC.1